jgi:hypothetical protein
MAFFGFFGALKKEGTFLGCAPKKSVRFLPWAPTRGAVESCVATQIFLWKCSPFPAKLRLDKHERNPNQTFPPLAGSGKCGSSDRPGDGRLLPLLRQARPRQGSSKTPTGQSSAIPDTSSDSLHVTPTTRGDRKNFAKDLPAKFLGALRHGLLRTDSHPQNLFRRPIFQHSEIPNREGPMTVRLMRGRANPFDVRRHAHAEPWSWHPETSQNGSRRSVPRGLCATGRLQTRPTTRRSFLPSPLEG